MNFVKENHSKGVIIPHATLVLGNLGDAKKLRLLVTNGAVVVLKNAMTAMDIIHAIDNLNEISSELLEALVDACGTCEDCGGCDGLAPDSFEGIDLPAGLLDAAGIPRNAKLCADADHETGTISIMQSDAKNDLSDLSPGMVGLLASCGICFDELVERLAEGDVIYGE